MLWWAPPSGDSDTPAGRPGEDHLGPAIEPVDERVEPAADERIVDGADGDQVLAGQLVGETELPQRHEEIHLGDAELDVAPLRSRQPAQHPLRALLVVRRRLGREDTDLVDPARQVRRGRDVRREGHDPLPNLRRFRQPHQRPAHRLLRRGHRRVGGAEALRDDRGRQRRRDHRRRRGECRAPFRAQETFRRIGRERGPDIVLGYTQVRSAARPSGSGSAASSD